MCLGYSALFFQGLSFSFSGVVRGLRPGFVSAFFFFFEVQGVPMCPPKAR